MGSIDGPRLRAAREVRDLSREELAELTERRVSARTIARLEAGEGTSTASLRLLVDALRKIKVPAGPASAEASASEVATSADGARDSGENGASGATPTTSAENGLEVLDFVNVPEARATPPELGDRKPAPAVDWEAKVESAERVAFEFVPASARQPAEAPHCPDTPIVIYTIHDGNLIPRELCGDEPGADIRARLAHERDWGASAVADVIASQLGLAGHYRVNLARCCLDFGRFPRTTLSSDDPLRAGAISRWLERRHGDAKSLDLLFGCYDRLASDWEAILRRELGEETPATSGAILLGIHSYDPKHESGDWRPPTSLLSRPASVQHHNQLAAGFFDALFPPEFAEFTADRLLLGRLALELERRYIPSANNFPYLLPEGSLELRTQVWLYFRRLQALASDDDALSAQQGEDAWRLLFEALCNTNSRKARTQLVRGYAAGHASAEGLSDELRSRLDAARELYESLSRYARDNRAEVVTDYQFSSLRTSSAVLEVRKDLLFDGDFEGSGFLPRHLISEEVERVGRQVAHAIASYVERDRPLKQRAEAATQIPRWRTRQLERSLPARPH